MWEILYGVHPVLEALRAERRRFKEIYISKKRRVKKEVAEIIRIAHAKDIPIKYRDNTYFNTTLESVVHQGVMARVDRYPLVDLSIILKRYRVENALPFILVLDGITDPQNLGSIIRTGVAAGIHGIVIPKDRSASPTPAVSKVSAGAMEHIMIARVTNITSTLKRLKKEGLWIVGADANAEQSIYGTDLKIGLALVLGGEEKGVRPLVKKTCDLIISIPQQETVSSLNVAIAGAIIIFEIIRQREGHRSF